MTVRELNRDQLIELKQDYLEKWAQETGERLSWGDYADADEEIPDEWVLEYYADYTFSDDDFLCSAGEG